MMHLNSTMAFYETTETIRNSALRVAKNTDKFVCSSLPFYRNKPVELVMSWKGHEEEVNTN